VSLTEDDVRHVARLARLALDDSEVRALVPQLTAILAYAETVGEVATDDVEPTTHPLGLTDVLREDVMVPSPPRDALLAGAPDPQDGRFGVPRIVDDEADDA
jgi:aspartyl-tRNA(Asn)/glutamyl-tRNA(Gln) amidotransferase subunit C